MASSWPRRSAFGASCALVTPTWLYNNAQEVGMQKMLTWQAIDSLFSSRADPLRVVNSTISQEHRMSQQMHFPSWVPPGSQFPRAFPWSIFTSRQSNLHQVQSQFSFQPS